MNKENIKKAMKHQILMRLETIKFEQDEIKYSLPKLPEDLTMQYIKSNGLEDSLKSIENDVRMIRDYFKLLDTRHG